MCGLLGFIGSSKDPIKTEALITELFDQTQIRGIDASGYYCTSEFYFNNVYFHKQPGPSIHLLQENVYKNIWKNKINLGLFHCRAASQGVGFPNDNINNHPFVSKNFKKAVIHNGLIIKNEYSFLKEYYQVESKCDSEIILRILEQEEESILENISNFLSLTPESHFAVAYSESDQNHRKLMLCRNKHRPLFFANLIDEIGQIIFFSTIEIFYKAINKIAKRNVFIKPQKIVEIYPHEIYEFDYYKNQNITMNLYKTIPSKETFLLKDDFFQIKNENKNAFNLENKNTFNLKDALFDRIGSLQNNQKKLEQKIIKMIKDNNIDKNEYEDILKTIEEINEKMNHINNTIKDYGS